ncbi:hypothetical protein [Marinicella meishanensis]|uniref:hypothetical protein n=1 Tax=Marinicella meishanensis TaxID=2873263 RepID=UPI001CBD25BF|nr:hypothetical protein [Marinicella sp. NBU2979]
MGASTAQEMDDFGDDQALLIEQSGVSGSVESWTALNVPGGVADFRRLNVDGGVSSGPAVDTSAAVAGGTLSVAFEIDGMVTNQSVSVHWSDHDDFTFWLGSFDASAYEALVLDMGLVTNPISVTLTLRDKTSGTQETQNTVIDTFGIHVFDLAAFQIDRSNLNLMGMRITRGSGITEDILANFNAIYFFDDDVIFASDFEPLD